MEFTFKSKFNLEEINETCKWLKENMCTIFSCDCAENEQLLVEWFHKEWKNI
jgi:hypothetical protein